MRGQFLQIRSAGISVIARSDEGGLIDTVRGSDFLMRYVPDFSFGDGKNSSVAGEPTMEIFRGERHFEMDYPKAVYVDRDPDERDIVSVAEMMLERERQSKGVHCLHSSCANIDGKGIIFWGGASGMGKTTMALSFDGMDGCSAYSDEKTLIDVATMRIVGGVHTAYLSKKELSDRYGANYLEFPQTEGGLPIALLVQPQVIPGAALMMEEWPSDKTEWHLYEELTRKIRGTSRRLFGNTLPVQSIDTEHIATQRSADSRVMSKSVRSVFIRGDEQAIRAAIIDLLR